MKKHDDVSREIWRKLTPETRFALLGLGLCSGPAELGELDARLVARLEAARKATPA